MERDVPAEVTPDNGIVRTRAQAASRRFSPRRSEALMPARCNAEIQERPGGKRRRGNSLPPHVPPERHLKTQPVQSIFHYACHTFALRTFLDQPGDGRTPPEIPATCVRWALLIGPILRIGSANRLEGLARCADRKELGLARGFGDDRIEVWDVADSNPWETLVENQGFNDGKNLYGMEHIQHHHPNSMLVNWLFLLLALMIERLYRNRYLHRRTHLILTAIQRRAPLPVGSLSGVRKSLAPTFRNRWGQNQPIDSGRRSSTI